VVKGRTGVKNLQNNSIKEKKGERMARCYSREGQRVGLMAVRGAARAKVSEIKMKKVRPLERV